MDISEILKFIASLKNDRFKHRLVTEKEMKEMQVKYDENKKQKELQRWREINFALNNVEKIDF